MRARWRLLGAAAALLSLLAAGAAGAQPQRLEDEIRSLLARAETATRAGDQEGALLLLERLSGRLRDRTEVSDAARPLVLRALVLYATALWEADRRQEADDVLDRIVEIDPGFEMPTTVRAALAQRFAARRERKVGFLRIGLHPADAEVLVDGQVIDPLPDLLPVLPGSHTVTARKPGYAPLRQEVEVRANRTEGVGFELDRSSATLRIATQPPGATVVVDRDVMGRTLDDGSSVSPPLVIAGLLPGWHEIEVTLADHRPFRQRIEVPELTDYDLGTLALERAAGMVVLRNLPAAAAVRVDGERVEPERQVGADGRPLASGSARLPLPVGEHLVVVAAPEGVYEAPIVVGDGESVSLDVRARPGIALLGIDGGDPLDRDAVRSELEPVLDGLERWFVLDRQDALAERLPPALEEERWMRFREAASRAVPEASLFLHVALPDAGFADHYVVRLWAPAPGPWRPMQIRVPLGDAAGPVALAEALAAPLPETAAWLGASLIDSGLQEGALVIGVHEDGPAARAGVDPGDRIVGVDGAPVGGVVDVVDRVRQAAPFSTLALEVAADSGRRAVAVTLGAGARVPQLSVVVAAPVLWAAAGTELAASASRVPAWTLQLTRALVLLRTGDAAGAALLLDGLQATGEQPFGQAAVDYWLGVALSSGDSPDLDAASRALQRAAQAADGRLEHNDGPRVAPRARARLAAIAAAEGS